MDLAFLKTAGAVAGIGGLALGVFLILFRDFLRRALFPQLSKMHAFRLLRLFLILVWSVAVAGIAAWMVLELRPPPVPIAVPAPPIPTPVASKTVTVCRGEEKAKCGTHDHFVGCGSVEDLLNALCVKYEKTSTVSRRSGECGYSTVIATCLPRTIQ